ncbi:MAG: hypothetical protein JST62_07770, partial [Bacteroidetes bacterium]|nr:hypothetical protein [Bacteroidota bacterium]
NDNSFEWMVNLPVLYNSGFFFSREETGFLVSTNVNIFSNTVGILIIVGGLLIGFSKEKQEDEYLQSLRLKAVFTSLGISYFIILILFVTVFGVMFFNFMIIAMYLPLVIYVFYWTYLLKNDK